MKSSTFHNDQDFSTGANADYDSIVDHIEEAEEETHIQKLVHSAVEK